MAVNPCCCLSLQKGCMLLAILDAVISMANLGLAILSLVKYLRYDQNDPDLTKNERTIGTVVVIVLTVICILQVLLAFRLFYGAKKKDYRNCRIWLLITTIVTIINIINVILNFTATDFEETSFAGTLVVVIYKLYEMLVVYFFLKDLRQEVQELRDQQSPVPSHNIAYPVQPQPIYVTSQSQQAYPMQQYAAYPTIPNQAYPAPVHRVTKLS